MYVVTWLMKRRPWENCEEWRGTHTCMHTCTYVVLLFKYICTDACMRTYICRRTLTLTCIRTYNIRMHPYTNEYVRMDKLAHIHSHIKYTHASIHPIYTYIYRCMHASIHHMHAHTLTKTHAYTYTYRWQRTPSEKWKQVFAGEVLFAMLRYIHVCMCACVCTKKQNVECQCHLRWHTCKCACTYEPMDGCERNPWVGSVL